VIDKVHVAARSLENHNVLLVLAHHLAAKGLRFRLLPGCAFIVPTKLILFGNKAINPPASRIQAKMFSLLALLLIFILFKCLSSMFHLHFSVS
jgi:hypothetical protein